jgi:hypothetical protein
MGRKQEFDDILPGTLNFITEATHHHSFGYYHRAGCFHFRTELDGLAPIFITCVFTCRTIDLRSPDLNQAHAAHSYRFHFWMVAKYRDIYANLLGGIHD